MALLMYWSTMQVYTSPTSGAVLLSDWHQTVDTNFGYVHTRRYFLISSSGELEPSLIWVRSGQSACAYLVPYSASKFAVIDGSVALRIKAQSIHVCGIYPSVIKSSLMERAIFRARMTRTLKPVEISSTRYKCPVVEKPEDVAQAIWDAVKISGLRC